MRIITAFVSLLLARSAVICERHLQHLLNDPETTTATTVVQNSKKSYLNSVQSYYLRRVIRGVLKLTISSQVKGEVFNDARCLAVVCDTYHAELLDLTLKKNLSSEEDFNYSGTVPSFAYVVGDEEDLDNPENETILILRRMVKEGCEMFVVLMKEGERAGKLLRFGDRNKELNTRAKFVLLHDPNLFSAELQDLWKKIVNVIFLRGHFDSSPWFELLTVHFPTDDSRTKLEGIWSRGSFLFRNSGSFDNGGWKRNDLFPEKTNDLHGRLLTVFTFDHVPSAIKREDGNSDNSMNAFHGIEIRISETLAEFMNFRIQLMAIGNDERWGIKDENGSWSGLLGAVSRGEVDIAIGNLFYSPYYLEKLDLTTPYTSQCLTFLTPESRTDKSWLTLVLPFKGPTWGAILSTLIIGGFLFRFISAVGARRLLTRDRDRKKRKNVSYPFGSLNDAILYSWGMLLQFIRGLLRAMLMVMVTHFWVLTHWLRNTHIDVHRVSLYEVPPPALPLSWPLRFLSGCWWLFCLLAAVAYRSSMTAVLSSPPPRLVYDTISDLASSGFSSGGWGEQPKQFFATALDAPSRRLAKRFESLCGLEASPQNVASRVAQGHFAYYENEYWLRDARAKYLRGYKRNGTATGPYSLHVMRECAINMPISVGLRDNSPLKARVDMLLRRVVEAGLIGKWLTDTMRSTLNAERNQFSAQEDDEIGVGENEIRKDNSEDGQSKKALMNLRKMYGAILALGVGYLLGLVALISEIVFHKKSGVKNIGLGPWVNKKGFQNFKGQIINRRFKTKYNTSSIYN